MKYIATFTETKLDQINQIKNNNKDNDQRVK